MHARIMSIKPHTSDFDRGQVAAYRKCGLLFDEIEGKTGVNLRTANRVYNSYISSHQTVRSILRVVHAGIRLKNAAGS